VSAGKGAVEVFPTRINTASTKVLSVHESGISRQQNLKQVPQLILIMDPELPSSQPPTLSIWKFLANEWLSSEWRVCQDFAIGSKYITAVPRTNWGRKVATSGRPMSKRWRSERQGCSVANLVSYELSCTSLLGYCQCRLLLFPF